MHGMCKLSIGGSRMHRIAQKHKENPAMTAAQLAEWAGVTRARVYQVLKSYEMKAPDATLRPFISNQNPVRSVGLSRKMADGSSRTSSLVGDLSELVVATDLLRRGAFVYRATTTNAPFDLVACIGADLARVEVRTAKIRPDGVWALNWPGWDRCDIVAACERDTGAVKYWVRPGFYWDHMQEENAHG